MERYFEINEAGHNIRCKLYCRDIHSIRQMVLFCHGFGGHKDNSAAAKFAERLTSKHKYAALVTFNLPCHGDDVKKKLELDVCLAYLDLVQRHLREKFETDELYCYATSFGGYLTMLYLHRFGSPFRKIVLRCPAIPMAEVLMGTVASAGDAELLRKGREVAVGFDRKVPVSPAFFQELKENDIRTYEFLDWAEDILIIHGTEDEIVPMEATHEFCENQLIEFIPIAGADHRFRSQRAMDQAIKEILEFFAL